MQINTSIAPHTFFSGPKGIYTLAFKPDISEDGKIEATIAGVSMDWYVETIEAQESGRVILCGLTRGTKAIWDDCFWFELIIDEHPIEIRYWNNGFIWRTDAAVRN